MCGKRVPHGMARKSLQNRLNRSIAKSTDSVDLVDSVDFVFTEPLGSANTKSTESTVPGLAHGPWAMGQRSRTVDSVDFVFALGKHKID